MYKRSLWTTQKQEVGLWLRLTERDQGEAPKLLAEHGFPRQGFALRAFPPPSPPEPRGSPPPQARHPQPGAQQRQRAEAEQEHVNHA